MQRWFFLDDRARLEMEVSPVPSIPTIVEPTLGFREWTFNLVMNYDLLPNETIAVSGASPSLGNWQPQNCVLLNNIEGTGNWTVTINIPRDRALQYRYFVCAMDPQTENLIIRRWETHVTPRIIPELGETSQSNDIFGDYNGSNKIDRGWLTYETIIQFKFFNAPFIWKQRMKKRLLYVKITPMNLRIQHDTACLSNLEESLSNDTRDNGVDVPSFAFAEVATFKYDDSVIKNQPQFGTPCGPEDIVVFHITVADPDNVAYLIDLYTYSSKASQDEPPYHLGYHYILPNVLKRSEGNLELPITCATKHRPLGMMQVGYLMIKPFQTYNFDMSVSYSRYWNKKWTGLDVGHRGSGTSFKAKDSVIRENTIASLKNAAAHGADMVEFDVQLSKDLVPVIYHDFHVYVSLKSKKAPLCDVNDFLELPMRELTLEQLKNFKVYHVVEGRTRELRNFDNEDLEEHQPFPQLADVLDALDPHVGFNIEIKWSQQLIDGTMESDQQFDKNLYVDCILDVVLRKACKRRIVFSCFDPDICTMLRYKQNIYPVMFLTLGVTNRYPRYFDPRCNTIEKAVCNARAMELLGIVAHTEDLLRDPTQVNLATNQGLIVFCWGDDNNSKDTIKMLKDMGLHAIIYDKMDVLTTKEVKESVFLVQAREIQNELFKIQCLELGRRSAEEQPPVIVCENEKFLELESQRRKISMSTATSIASLLEEQQVEQQSD